LRHACSEPCQPWARGWFPSGPLRRKRDSGRSPALYEQGMARHPERPRAGRFLAGTRGGNAAARQARDAIQKLMQGSVAYAPSEGHRAQQWAMQVEAEFEEELK
jgi:hypothetical protein